MKGLATFLAAACATAILAKPVQVKSRALPTIEVAPGETRRLTKEERWELAASGTHFFDITKFNTQSRPVKEQPPYPKVFKHEENIRRLFPKLSWDNIKKNIEHYSTYHTRSSETETGVEAAEWLFSQVSDVVKHSNKAPVIVEMFPHAAFPQKIIIVKIPGRSNRTIIIGGHLDSVDPEDVPRLDARAPGVDDNASGLFLILEALRDIFTQYAATGRDVRLMLQQDMVGYTEATLDAGKPESFGLITDYTDAALNEFLRRVINEVRYCASAYGPKD
ncbi:Zn-dependent exopeptidase [Setomelanomma holmii]|uniref:Peptide hydrolase n=1 Tax=Setomelanomma holmii TaxID=210430 RepID=A0A9P4HHN8_9PLEO|nr:Zn-dependent exopeptidase [Setomelanomma holmii]